MILVALWMMVLLWSPMRIDIDKMELAAAPIWMNIRWFIVGSLLATSAVGWYSLARPFALRTRERMRIAIEAANLFWLGILLYAGEWSGAPFFHSHSRARLRCGLLDHFRNPYRTRDRCPTDRLFLAG